MNVQTLKNINKALAESGESVKLKLKNAKELKTGNFILKDMWCGVLIQVFFIDVKNKEIKKGNFFNIEGKTKFGLYKDFQPVKFKINKKYGKNRPRIRKKSSSKIN